MSEVRHHSVAIPEALAGKRLDQALAELYADYSRTLLKAWIRNGQVLVNGLACRPRDTVNADDRVEIRAVLAASATTAAEAIEFGIAHEDADLIVVDKPAALVVHPGAGNPRHTLVNGLLFRFPELAALPRAGLIHRLDKDTSGLLVVARNPYAFQALTEMMAARAISRGYDAVVTGVMVAGGSIDAAIGRDRVSRTRMRVTEGGRDAVTHYRVTRKFRAHTRIEVRLETGRTHQIRVHMQHLGYPILGDPAYGARAKLPRNPHPALTAALAGLKRPVLHARRLEFAHPRSGEVLRLESPLPVELDEVIAALAADAAAAGGS